MAILSIEGGPSAARVETGLVTFTVRLSEAADAVTVDYQTKAGAAVLCEDVRGLVGPADPLAGTASFAPGRLVQTIRLSVDSDACDEIDGSFFVEPVNPRGASFGGANGSLRAVGWRLDDDGVGLNRAIAVTSPTVVESNGAVAVFSVDLLEPSDTGLTLRYRTVGGTASQGGDYVGKSGSITFAPGQTHAEVRVPIESDLRIESAESFQLQILQPFPSAISGSAIVSPGVATILDYAIRGNGGNGVLTGTPFAERVEGLGGNDALRELGGSDAPYGGSGNDRLDGGNGRDTLIGGGGNDAHGTPGDDVIQESANGGVDRVLADRSTGLQAHLESLTLLGKANIDGIGNSLDNAMTGSNGSNRLIGKAGDDALVGRGGVDTLRVGGGDDPLKGGAGREALDGGGGRDRPVGGGDRDTLSGGAAADRLAGNAGHDIFLHASRAEAGDRIADFRNRAGETMRSTSTRRHSGDGPTAGRLAASQILTRTDNRAQDANDRFIFRTTDRTLWFDGDGDGRGGLTLIADLQAGATATAADIILL